MKELFLKLIISTLPGLLAKLTPAIREMVEDGLKNWYAHAMATPNPYDDYLVKLLAGMLDVELDAVVKEAAAV